MKIKVKASAMVKLWISNLDAVLPENYHTLTHYFYRSTAAADFFDQTVLKASLSRALDEFYPMAGRLNKDTDRVDINCNGHGALFVEAESDATLNDLGDFRPRPEITLIPRVDYSQGISTFPLLLVKSPNLGITSWVRMPLYEADFGWGRPVYVGLGSLPAEGHVIVLPSPGNDGSLLLAMSMQKEQLQAFEKLFYHI